MTNDNVALSYFQNTNKRVKAGEENYIFIVKRNVNIAWVKPEHVSQILAIRRDCCGGNGRPVFHYTSEQELRVWNGAER